MAVKTKPLVIRLSVDEAEGLSGLAAELSVTKSTLVRRLVREAVRGGPSYFDGDQETLKSLLRSLGASQRNLSQLTAAYHALGNIEETELAGVLGQVGAQLGALKSWAMSEVRSVSQKNLDRFRIEEI